MAKSGLSGVTYYKLEKRYEGDVTKNCGLTGTEIDANFHFLRGRDIKNMEFNEDGVFIVTLLDGTVFEIENFKEYIASAVTEAAIIPTLSGSSYDDEEGVLTLILDGEEYNIGGFFTKDNIGVYVTRGLKGDGSKCNPIRIPGVEDTGFLAPVEKLIIGSVEENDVDKEKRYLSKEKTAINGYFYTFEGLKEVEEILNEENSGWRIPSFEEWGGMLNGLEYCEESAREHDNRNPGSYGYEAGFAAKADSWEDEPLGNNSICISQTENEFAALWSIDEIDGEILSKAFSIHHGDVENILLDKSKYYPIRLIKDITCDGEGAGIVVIDGKPYETVQMTHILSGETNSKLWIKTNLAIALEDTDLYKDADSGETTYKYFVNEFDHILNRWLKKELKPNYSIVIKSHGERENDEFINIDGELVSKWGLIEDFVNSTVQQEREERIEAIENEANERKSAISGLTYALNEEIRQRGESEESINREIIGLKNKDEQIESDIRSINEEISNINETTQDLDQRLENEIHDRIVDSNILRNDFNVEIDRIKQALSSETITREQYDIAIIEAISREVRDRITADEAENFARKDYDNYLLNLISAETRNRINALWDEANQRENSDNRLLNIISAETRARELAILNEAQERERAENLIYSAISAEARIRENRDAELLGAISAETRYRKESDESISLALSAETRDRKDADEDILEALSAETRQRKEIDELLHRETIEGLYQEAEKRMEGDERLHTEIALIVGTAITIVDGLLDLSASTVELSAATAGFDSRISNVEQEFAETKDYVQERLEQEKEEREASDSAITALVSSGLSSLGQAIEAEKQEREEADSEIMELVNSGLSALSQEMQEVNSGFSALTESFEEFKADYSAETENIWFAINEKEAAVISRDIVFTGKTGEQVTIHSGESVTDAIETVALNAGGGGGGGDGKVKDILVNDNSILDEETGIADLNIENADADISIEMTGTTMYVNVTGISNNVIDLT